MAFESFKIFVEQFAKNIVGTGVENPAFKARFCQ